MNRTYYYSANIDKSFKVMTVNIWYWEMWIGQRQQDFLIDQYSSKILDASNLRNLTIQGTGKVIKLG